MNEKIAKAAQSEEWALDLADLVVEALRAERWDEAAQAADLLEEMTRR